MIDRRAQRDSSISIFRIIAVACAICIAHPGICVGDGSILNHRVNHGQSSSLARCGT